MYGYAIPGGDIRWPDGNTWEGFVAPKSLLPKPEDVHNPRATWIHPWHVVKTSGWGDWWGSPFY